MGIEHHATILRVHSPCDFKAPEEYLTESQIVNTEKFGIDDVRELIRQAYQRPSEGLQQLLIVQTEFITHEAQNALLKVLEEPPLSTKFLFVVPPDFVVLPTLASRFQVMMYEDVTEVEKTNTDFKEFLSCSYAERLAKIEDVVKKSDIVWQRSLKRGLVEYLSASGAQTRLGELEYAARMLLTRGASNKMLFEHVALTLPVS